MAKYYLPILLLLIAWPNARAETTTVALKVENFRPVIFEKIPPTQYQFENDTLTATVNASSSFLLLAYDKIRPVSTVRFEWQSTGALKIKDQEQEESKAGDDAYVRVGLILSGNAPLIPFFAAAWLKAVRDNLKLPSNRMLYIIPSPHHKPGSKWVSPYSGSIDYIVPQQEPLKDGWQVASIKFSQTLAVVGIWLMSDGDNTQSQFVTKLRQLTLE